MPPFISLCMIVKNEEKVLGRCLDSVKNYIDEIVIADTGSTDKTKNIGASYTEKIFDFSWNDDFSAARNFVQSKASGKWIIYLDADEFVEEENFREITNQLRYMSDSIEIDAFVVTQVNFVGTLAGNVNQTPTLRIYRNDSTIRFQRKIHEQLYKINGQLSVGSLGLNIYHSGYLKNTFEEKGKNNRNVSLIKKELEIDPTNGFDHFNLGNEYLAEWKVEEALVSYQNAFKYKDTVDILWVPMAVERLIFCLIELKKYNEALGVIKDAIELWPNAADFKSQRALIFFFQNRFDDAKKELYPLIEHPKGYTIIQSLNYLEYLPYFILGRISEIDKDFVNAVYFYSKVLNYNDKDSETLKQLYPLLLRYDSEESFINFIKNNNSMKNDINRAYLLKILLDFGKIDLVEYFLKEWRIVASDGFRIKLNIIKGRFNFAKSLLNKGSLNNLLNEGWIDPYDILVLSMQLGKKELFQQLIDVNREEDFTPCISLFIDEPTTDLEKLKSHTVALIERCIKTNNFKLIDLIINNVSHYNFKAEIGNLFYRYGFVDIAMDFYSKCTDYSQLDNQVFVNIIESFRETENELDAIKWGLDAIEQNYTDYRIYKNLAQLLEKRGEIEDLLNIINWALTIYPESDFLESFRTKIKNA